MSGVAATHFLKDINICSDDRESDSHGLGDGKSKSFVRRRKQQKGGVRIDSGLVSWRSERSVWAIRMLNESD
jgi:hypothetical protein